jgi:DNA-binding transcriptional regulator of glucitol operon
MRIASILRAPARPGGASIIGMSSDAPRSRWLFVLRPKWLAWHAFAVVATLGMLWLGDWQFHRAESGNALSWAYTFEWPIFAAFGVFFWAKTIIDEGKPKLTAEAEAAATAEAVAEGEAATAALPGRRHVAGAVSSGDEDDEADHTELDEYNAYLAKLHKQAHGHGKWHGLR